MYDRIPYENWINPSPSPLATLDAYAVHKTLSTLVNKMNELQRSRNDLESLIDFLEKNPGSSVSDWARYEGVKRKLKEVA